MYPDLSTQVTTKIDNAKRTTDKNRVERMFHIEDTLSVVNFQGRSKWLAGVLEEQLGPLTFRVRLKYRNRPANVNRSDYTFALEK